MVLLLWWYVSEQQTIQIPRHILQTPLPYQFIIWVDANAKCSPFPPYWSIYWSWLHCSVFRWGLKGVRQWNVVELGSVNSNPQQIHSHRFDNCSYVQLANFFQPHSYCYYPVDHFRCNQCSFISVKYGVIIRIICNISTFGHTLSDNSLRRQSFGQFIGCPEASEFAWHMPDSWNGWVGPSLCLIITTMIVSLQATEVMIRPFYDR